MSVEAIDYMDDLPLEDPYGEEASAWDVCDQEEAMDMVFAVVEIDGVLYEPDPELDERAEWWRVGEIWMEL